MKTRILFILLFFWGLSGNVIAKSPKSMADLEYSIEGQGTGKQGSYLVNVTVTTDDKNLDESWIKRCAVHGVLFRGFGSVEHRQNQKPLAGSAMIETQHADFFQQFFYVGNTFQNYADLLPNTRKILKSGKKYKVSSVVSVQKEQLRKDLESAGVVRGLNSAF